MVNRTRAMAGWQTEHPLASEHANFAVTVGVTSLSITRRCIQVSIRKRETRVCTHERRGCSLYFYCVTTVDDVCVRAQIGLRSKLSRDAANSSATCALTDAAFHHPGRILRIRSRRAEYFKNSSSNFKSRFFVKKNVLTNAIKAIRFGVTRLIFVSYYQFEKL